MRWENVYVFISSTFNDMHAERDYLVKRVFPELRIWCAKHRLKLIDVDLRWGVSEEDATENKRVVEVCLKNIDRCRPFFLCFLGQRRGWVPSEEDVNPDTLKEFPELKNYLGKASVTEMEIIHAVLHPMDQAQSPVRHTGFYFRDDGYVKNIQDKEVRELYAPGYGFFARSDKKLKAFKKQLQKTENVYTYQGRWNPNKQSPELKSIQGKDLSKGRLEDFQVDDMKLGEHILNWLKLAITEEFPEHMEVEKAETELAKELNRQDTALFQACDAYIERPAEEQALLSYVQGDGRAPFLLYADAGAGKTSLTAHMIQEHRFGRKTYYRLIGQTADSSTPGTLVSMLVQEWVQDGLLDEKMLEESPKNLLLKFPQILEWIGNKEKILLVLDGIDQFRNSGWNVTWIPAVLPEQVKVILSLRFDGNEELLRELSSYGMQAYHLGLMAQAEEKKQMIQGYLGQFLKNVDEQQLSQITKMRGSGNPLYLKIVLNELRVFGSFDTLFERLQTDYGNTPKEAFEKMIVRIYAEETDRQEVFGTYFIIFLGTLAYSMEGVRLEGYQDIFRLSETECRIPMEELMDELYGIVRHLNPYLVISGGQVNYLYDSFRQAAKNMCGENASFYHKLLAGYYSCRILRQEHERIVYVQFLYHCIRTSQELTDSYMTDPEFVMDFIQYAGARAFADACIDGAEHGFEGYRELGIAVRSAAARLDVYPYTLFLELKRSRFCGSMLVSRLLEGQKKCEPKAYLEPMGRRTAGKILERENAIESRVKELHPADDCIVFVRYRDIWTVDKETFIEIRKISFPSRFLSVVRQNQLYLVFYGEQDTTVRVYSLPWLECIKEETGLPKQKEKGFFLRGIQAVDDKVYSLYMSWRLEEPEEPEKPDEAFLSCVQTAEKLWQGSFCEERKFRAGIRLKGPLLYICGSFFFVRDKATGRTWLYSLCTGEEVWRRDLPAHSDLYVCSEEGHLYLFTYEDGPYFVYHFLVDGNRVREAPDSGQEIAVKYIARVSVAGDFFYLESDGGFYLLDRGFREMGFVPIGIDRYSHEWGGLVELYQDYLLIYAKDKVMYFREEDLLSCPQQDGGQRKEQKLSYLKPQNLVRDGQLYVLEDGICRVDLATGKETWSDDGINVAFTYDLENQFLGLIMGVNAHINAVIAKSPERMAAVLLWQIPDIGELCLEQAFILGHSLGVVLTDKEAVYLGREDMPQYAKDHFQYVGVEVRLYDITDDFRHQQTWRLEEHVHSRGILDSEGLKVIEESDEVFLVLPDVYLEEKKRAVRVYRIIDQQCIWQKKYEWDYEKYHADASYGSQLSNRQMIVYRHRLVFTMRERNQWFLYEIHPLNKEIYVTCTGGPVVAGDMISDHLPDQGENIYIRMIEENALGIYSLKTHRMEESITFADRRNYSNVFQAGGLILRVLSEHEIEAYDPKTGEKVFIQYLEDEMAHLYVDDREDIICSQDTKKQRTYWRLHR